MATRKTVKTPKAAQPLKVVEDAEIGAGVNSTTEEIEQLGGLAKLRAKIKAKQDKAKNAKQPRV
jgi:hypothetical protein